MSITSVSFALLLIDDFDGSVINTQNVLFSANGRKVNPLKKEDGFYVFLGEYPQLVCLSVKLRNYIEITQIIDTSVLSKSEPIVRFRFLRNPSSYFGGTSAIISGNIEKLDVASPVRCYAIENMPLKLADIQKGENGSIITITGFSLKNLVGLKYSISEGKSKETFEIISKLSHNTYQLNRFLSFSHKSGEIISRVYSGFTNKDGSYSIFVDNGQDEKIKKVEYCKGGKGRWVSSSVTVHK